MDRAKNLQAVERRASPWDVVVIGGGATGAGCALDAASRGLDVLLLEQHDFGKGTSSRSTKLIHGGVRYLRQGNISLVREALKERGLLLKNAPHVVHEMRFVIPCYGVWQKAFYGTGMKIYDALSGEYGLGGSHSLSADEVGRLVPTIERSDLSGGVLYHDGQFDDTRLLIDLLSTASAHGANVLNYARVERFSKGPDGRIAGLTFTDIESAETFRIEARAVINATGAFCDPLRRMSDWSAKLVVTFAQGIHIALDRRFMPSDSAVLIPKTRDGRVLFCVPWHQHLLVGTTDTPIKDACLEPEALASEVDFVLETAGGYLTERPSRRDILSVFAGVRPLVRSTKKGSTSSLSRGHALFVDGSGLITITGGKWTTYRRMAEDAVDEAVRTAALPDVKCRTESLPVQPPETIAALSRKIKGVLGHSDSAANDSFCNGLLEPPLFTRPREILGQNVPAVLLSGNHAMIADWNENMSWLVTGKKRPDLFRLAIEKLKNENPHWKKFLLNLQSFDENMAELDRRACGLGSYDPLWWEKESRG